MEIQKAEELIVGFARMSDMTTDEMRYFVEAIRARDKAIIERCKIALIECSEIGVDKYLFALDSILRDLD